MLIPADYWNGRDTLELEYPWLTPEAIVVLDHMLQPDHQVLEFGAGGSTMFFARRCDSVLSFESRDGWATVVQDHITAVGVGNADVRVARTIAECETVIGGATFDVVLVDCDDIPRLDAARATKRLVRPGGCMVIDNYDHFGPERLDESFFADWTVASFDDEHWMGRGTRIFLNGEREGFVPVDVTLWGRSARSVRRNARSVWREARKMPANPVKMPGRVVHKLRWMRARRLAPADAVVARVRDGWTPFFQGALGRWNLPYVEPCWVKIRPGGVIFEGVHPSEPMTTAEVEYLRGGSGV